MIDLAAIEALSKAWEYISHGPCFPLRVTARFKSNRIEDCHGNVVIEQPDIWLPEAAEYLVMAGNMLPDLLKLAREAIAARAWLEADSTLNNPLSATVHRADIIRHGKARDAYRALVEKHGEVGE